MADIKPGMTIKVVTEIDLVHEKIRVRNSVVYDITATGSMILAQTDPAVSKSMLHKEVTVTYLVKQKGEWHRYGFPATVTDLIESYKLSGGREVRAIEVVKKEDAAPYSIRMFYRVAPTERSGLRMFVYGRKVNILDISLGGVKFSYDKGLELEMSRVIQMRLDIGDASYKLEGMILRTWDAEDERFINHLGFASAEFIQVDTRLENALSRKIREIERESRYNEVG